jgi:hypothetical protein
MFFSQALCRCKHGKMSHRKIGVSTSRNWDKMADQPDTNQFSKGHLDVLSTKACILKP